jgi:hypothetical protein
MAPGHRSFCLDPIDRSRLILYKPLLMTATSLREHSGPELAPGMYWL